MSHRIGSSRRLTTLSVARVGTFIESTADAVTQWFASCTAGLAKALAVARGVGQASGLVPGLVLGVAPRITTGIVPGIIVAMVSVTVIGMVACTPPPLEARASRAFELFQRQHIDHPQAETLKEGLVVTSAGDYHFVEMGQGPTLILYHGFPSFWYAWKNLMPVLAEHFRVIAVDGLGANLSSKPADLRSYEVSALADQLGQVIDELGGEPVYLVGHDWGGALVWSFAQAYPERVKAFASFSAPPLNLFLRLLSSDATQQKASAYIDRVKALTGRELPDDAAAFMTQVGYGGLLKDGLISKADYQAFGAGLARPHALRSTAMWYAANIPGSADIDDADFWPSRQARANVPGLLIWGEEDRTFVGRFVELASDYAEPLSVVTIPGVGHWPMFEASEKSQAALVDFLLSQR